MCRRFSILIIASLTIANAQALPEDAHAVLHITADSAIYNYKTGMKIFTGHVKVDQGTTHIEADKLITKNNSNHQVALAIAYGFQNKARYQTVPKKNDATLYAEAKTITFYPLTLNAILENQAKVTQKDDVFEGARIAYNNANQTVSIPAVKNSRALLVYHPES